MKVIKLDRRFKANREAGYQVALRFTGYWDDRARINEIERICKNRLKGGRSLIYEIEVICKNRLKGGRSTQISDWVGYFGKRKTGESTPYYIMFRRESDMTFVLMCADLTTKS